MMITTHTMRNFSFLDKIKPEHQQYVREVSEYMANRGVEVALKGSANKGDFGYEDIDLLGTGDTESIANVFAGFERRSIRTAPFPEQSSDGTPYEVKCISKGISYVGVDVDYRFRILAPYSDKDTASIDVSLQATDRTLNWSDPNGLDFSGLEDLI